MIKQTLNKNKTTPIEEFADIGMNALIIVSFVKIILTQWLFLKNNTEFFGIIFLFMFLLLFNNVSKVIRASVSAYSLYLFFTETGANKALLNSVLSLIVSYLLLYIIFRKGLVEHFLKKGLNKERFNFEVISNCLALAIFIKFVASYFTLFSSYISLSSMEVILLALIFSLLIPVLEDISRLIISIFSTIDVLTYLAVIASPLVIACLIFVIFIFGLLNYRLRTKKS